MPNQKLQLDLQRLAANPLEFATALRIPSAHRGTVRFGNVMADFQRQRFADLAPDLLALARDQQPPRGKHWWEATKGASKDSDLAVALVWLLAFSSRPLVCQIGAADQDQADELRKAAKEILRLNPWLCEAVEIQRTKIIGKRNGSEAEIIAADVAGSHGARPDVLILNELSHVTKQEFAENLLDNAAKVPRGLVVVATNAGFVDTWQYAWRETARTSDRWAFHKWDKPSPWLNPGDIAEAKRRTTQSRFLRLWHGVWSTGQGDAIDPDDIKAAITLSGPTLAPEPGWLYVAGLDIGLVKDATGLVVIGKHVGHYEEEREPEQPPRPRIASILDDLGLLDFGPAGEKQSAIELPEAYSLHHAGTGRLRLCRVNLWQTRARGEKVDVTSIECAILRLHQELRLECVAFDPHQAAYLAQRLQRQNVPMLQVDFTPANLRSMASATLEAFQNRNIELYDEPAMIADLHNARAVEKNYGVRLEWPKGKTANENATEHGDVGTALAVALHATTRYGDQPAGRIDGPLTVYP